MDRRFWGVAAMAISLLLAGMICMRLQQSAWEHTDKNVRSVVDIVDSIAKPSKKESPLQLERQRVKSLSEQLHGISEMQQRPTDSLQQIIAEENLLNSGTSPE